MNKKDAEKVFVAVSPHQKGHSVLRASARSETKNAPLVTGRAGDGLKEHKETVFVAMSGGVDSSVAAFLLKEQGYDVVGVFMRCYNLDGCAERDAEDARRVAARLGIPFYVWDFEKEYKKLVVDYMIRGYRKGITPNPDVMCNKEIKFGLFFEKARSMGADYVATGHYVRLRRTLENVNSDTRNGNPKSQIPCRMSLYAARDSAKDQSYFLWTLTQEQLKHCLFPIGDYLKSEVREIARRVGLPTAEKKDSQGICFLGQIALGDFLKKYIKPKRGVVLTVSGEKIGEHEGAYYYTIGQRHLGIANRKAQSANSEPFYVAEKNVKTNTITVAEGAENPALYRKEVELTSPNFIDSAYHSTIRANGGVSVLARVRYRQPLFNASFIIRNSLFKLVFDKPQKFVAAGQSAVFYAENGELLGGGIIL